MKSLHSLIRQSSLMLMAGLFLVFSVLTYIGGDALFLNFVDARLSALVETLAKFVEHYPAIIEGSDKDASHTAELNLSKKEQHELQDATHSLRVFSKDGRLVWKSPNSPAQQPLSDRLLVKFVSGTPCLKPLRRPMASLFDMYSFRFHRWVRSGTFCRQRHPCSCIKRHATVL